jgi:hypothetical protein
MRTVYRLLKPNRLVGESRLKLAAVALTHAVGLRHLVVRIDPVVACNLRCTMCYFSNNEYVRAHKGIFFHEEIARIAAPFFLGLSWSLLGAELSRRSIRIFPR